jgi:hypothetical protein
LGLDLAFLITGLASLEETRAQYFRKLYDKRPVLYQRYSDEELLTLRDELRLLWEFDAKRKTEMDGLLVGPEVGWRAERLDRLVRESDEPPQKVICDYWLRNERQPIQVEWTKAAKKIKPRPECLRAVLVWGCVKFAGRLKFCENPDCKHPYFISRRKDQKYCSDECTAPAKREAKRKWWSLHRGGLGNEKAKGGSSSRSKKHKAKADSHDHAVRKEHINRRGDAQ